MENNFRALFPRILKRFLGVSGIVSKTANGGRTAKSAAWRRVLFTVCLVAVFSLTSSGAWAIQTITQANVATGSVALFDNAVLATNINLPATLTIIGNGHEIDMNTLYFIVPAGGSELTLTDVTMTNANQTSRGGVFQFDQLSTDTLTINTNGSVIFSDNIVTAATINGSVIYARGNIFIGTNNVANIIEVSGNQTIGTTANDVVTGGAIYSREGNITIGNDSSVVRLIGNHTTGVAAAVYTDESVPLSGRPGGGHIRIYGSSITIAGNSADMHSGAIYTGNDTIRSSIFIGTESTQRVVVGSNLNQNNEVIGLPAGNTAAGSGGALQAAAGTVTIKGQEIILAGNTVTNSGGIRGSGGGGAILGAYGVYIGNDGSIVRIVGNEAVGRGGAIYVSTTSQGPAAHGNVEIRGSEIYLIDNRAGFGPAGVITVSEATGGGALFANRSIVIEGNKIVISGNKANTHGGAIEATQNVTITGSVTATGNETVFNIVPLSPISHQGGGAIWAGGDVTLNATGDSSFIGNTAGGTSYGGAIRAGGTVTLNAIGGDITFQGNVSHLDPAAGYQRGQAIWFDNVSGDGAVFHAESGLSIIFDGNSIDNDEAQGLLTVRTTGPGAVIFDGATSGIYGDTTVEAGTFVVRNDAVYGLLQADAQNLAGGAGATELSSFTVSAGSTLAGGALDGGVRAGTVAADNIRISGTLDIAGTGIPTLGHTAGNAEGGYSEFTLRGANQTFDADSQILFNTYLNDASTQLTDLLILELEGGQTSSDEAMIIVRNTGGGGAVCTGDGIMLVQTNDGISEGAFRLGNRVAAGAFQYLLFQGGIDGNPDNAQNWYLRSRIVDESGGGGNGGGQPPTIPIYRPEVPIGIVVPALASRLGLSTLGTWHERRDGEFATNYIMPDGYERAGWARVFGNVGRYGRGYSGSLTSRANSFYKHGPSYDFSITGIQAGVDLRRRENDEEDNRWRDMFGLYFAAGWARADVYAIKDFGFGLEAGRTRMTGYSIGAYYTYIDQDGWYVDAVLQATRYSNISTTSRIDEPQRLSTRGWGWLASLESGYPIELNDYWIIEPQAQLIYEHLSIRDGSDAFGRISFSNSGTLYGRLGARLNRDWARDDGRRMNAWGRASLWSDFGSQARTTFSNLEGLNPRTFGVDLGGTWAQFDLGITGQLSDTTSVFAVGNYNVSVRSIRGYSWGGRIGLRVNW